MTTALDLPELPNLSNALDAIDRATAPAARVKAAADAIAAFGFGSVLITLRDAALSPTLAVTAGTDSVAHQSLQPLPGVVWRRRLSGIQRFRSGDLYALDGTDAWVAREFFGTSPVRRERPGVWLPADLIVGLIRGAEHELLGVAKIAAPCNREWPSVALRRDISGILRHLGARLAHDNLRAVAQRRAERLQRLQEAGAALARSLDEREIIHELARQAARAVRADGVVIASPDLQEQTLTTLLRMHRGVVKPGGISPLGDGVIAEVARTGLPVRVGDRAADRERDLSGRSVFSTFDVVGEDGPAASVMAVPLLMGIRLIGVVGLHAAPADVFSPEDEEVMATMASQAATAIANARRYSESERERRQTEALADVARAVSGSLRPGDVLRLILRHAVALLGAGGAGVALRTGDYMHIVAAVGEAEMLAGVHLPVDSSLMGKVATTGERLVSNDYSSDPRSNRAIHRIAPVSRAVYAPLTTPRGIIGALAVMNRDVPFTEEDGRILQRLADHVAVAIVNAQLFDEVERATREWKVAFDSISTGMVVLDDLQRIKRCNTRALELCGESSFHSVLGTPFGDALVGSNVAARADGINAIIASALESQTAIRRVFADERGGRMFEVSTSPHPDGGIVVTFDDVSSMHRLAEQHRRVVEMSSDAIVITTPDRTISMANPAAHLLFERGSELIGMRVPELVDAASLDQVGKFEKTVFNGAQQQYECAIRRPDGSVRRVAVSSAPIVETGKVTGSVASLRDITDHVRPSDRHAERHAELHRRPDAA